MVPGGLAALIVSMRRNARSTHLVVSTQVQFAAWAAEQAIAFNAFEGDRLKLILAKLRAARSEHALNIRKHQLEIYVAIKERIAQ